MATRQEELQNLKTMYSALSRNEKLIKEISNKKEEIRFQKSRRVEGYPEYTPKRYSEKEIGVKLIDSDSIISISRIIFLILSCVLGIAEFIFMVILEFKFPESETAGIAMWLMLYNLPLVAFFIPYVGMLVTSICYLINFGLCKLMLYDLEGDPKLEGLVQVFLFSVIVIAAFYIIWLTIVIISKCADKKRYKKYKEQETKKYNEDRQIYAQKRALAMVDIEKKRETLSSEVSAKVTKLENEIRELENSILDNKQIILQTPGLASQDKNLYTVSTLINYFERGKADSIKEAINIFDLEERERARDSERRTAQFIADIERRAALERMEREQYSHNQAMRDSARRIEQEQKEHNEKIQRELDDIKNGR